MSKGEKKDQQESLYKSVAIEIVQKCLKEYFSGKTIDINKDKHAGFVDAFAKILGKIDNEGGNLLGDNKLKSKIVGILAFGAKKSKAITREKSGTFSKSTVLTLSQGFKEAIVSAFETIGKEHIEVKEVLLEAEFNNISDDIRKLSARDEERELARRLKALKENVPNDKPSSPFSPGGSGQGSQNKR